MARKIETTLGVSGRRIKGKKLGAYNVDGRAREAKVRGGEHNWFSDSLLLLGPESQGPAAAPEERKLGCCCGCSGCPAVLAAGCQEGDVEFSRLLQSS